VGKRAIRAAVIAASASGVGVGTVVAHAVPAEASEQNFPSGCALWAKDPSYSWQYMCYVSPYDWNTNKTAVAAVNQILQHLYYPDDGACTLSAADDTAVKSYQLTKGLSIDGVVGPATYTSLQSQLLITNIEYGVGPYGPTEETYWSIGAGPQEFVKHVSGFGVDNNQWLISLQGPSGPFKFVGVGACA
jgi:hypothetical protein